MSMPADVTMVPVHGIWTGMDGRPEVGHVSLQVASSRLVHEASTVVMAEPITAALDLNGEVSFSVPATDDPSFTAGVPTYYQTLINLSRRQYGFALSVPSGTVGTIELAAYSDPGAVPPSPGAGIPVTIASEPLRVNLAAYAGDDFTFTVFVYNQDGSDYDLTDAVITAQIRDWDDTLLGEFSTSVSGNQVLMTVPGALSATLPPSSKWDCQMAEPEVKTLVAGTLAISPQVTK